jgi:hypothetical protein
LKIRPHICAALAAYRADETMLYVGQPKVIRPLIGADGDAVAAAIVGAIDKQPRTPMSRISAKVILVGRSVIRSS